jgi:hypothetical protein
LAGGKADSDFEAGARRLRLGLSVLLFGLFLLTAAATLEVLGHLRPPVLAPGPDTWSTVIEPNLHAVIMAGVVFLGLGWFIHRGETAPPRYLRPPGRSGDASSKAEHVAGMGVMYVLPGSYGPS